MSEILGIFSRSRGPFGSRPVRRAAVLVFVAAALVPAAPSRSTILVHLDNCLPDGCLMTRGPEDAALDQSSIMRVASGTLTGFSHGPEVWAEVVACVREAWRPFDVAILKVAPGHAPYIEHKIAGTPEQLGLGGVSGVSPFNFQTCGLYPNSISFTFDVRGPDPVVLCNTANHEIAHQLGLDHEAYKPDPMTYIPGCGRKDFAAVDAPCGESTPRGWCLCVGGATQNSYARLAAVAGPNPSGFLFEGTFQDVDEDWICDWSSQVPPPAELAGEPTSAPVLPELRCGTFDPEIVGLQRSLRPGL